MKQPRNNKLQIVRIAAPMIEEQEESLKTLKDLLEQEETVSSLSFNKNNEEFIHTPYRLIQYLFCRKFSLPGRIYFL